MSWKESVQEVGPAAHPARAANIGALKIILISLKKCAATQGKNEINLALLVNFALFYS